MELTRLTAADIAELKELMGETKVSSGSSNLDLHSRDESYHEPHRPDVVVWPVSTGDVVKAVKFASDKNCAVTPWCARQRSIFPWTTNRSSWWMMCCIRGAPSGPPWMH